MAHHCHFLVQQRRSCPHQALDHAMQTASGIETGIETEIEIGTETGTEVTGIESIGTGIGTEIETGIGAWALVVPMLPQPLGAAVGTAGFTTQLSANGETRATSSTTRRTKPPKQTFEGVARMPIRVLQAWSARREHVDTSEL